MRVRRCASGVRFRSGGESHSGWLPPGAVTPLPTPIREVTPDFAIEGGDGEGFRLIVAAAESAAAAWFGIGPDAWRDG